MLKVIPTKFEARKNVELSLDEIAREGTRRLLTQALHLEVVAERENSLSAITKLSKTLANFESYFQVVAICSKILFATSCHNPFFKSVPDKSDDA